MTEENHTGAFTSAGGNRLARGFCSPQQQTMGSGNKDRYVQLSRNLSPKQHFIKSSVERTDKMIEKLNDQLNSISQSLNVRVLPHQNIKESYDKNSKQGQSSTSQAKVMLNIPKYAASSAFEEGTAPQNTFFKSRGAKVSQANKKRANLLTSQLLGASSRQTRTQPGETKGTPKAAQTSKPVAIKFSENLQPRPRSSHSKESKAALDNNTHKTVTQAQSGPWGCDKPRETQPQVLVPGPRPQSSSGR